MKKIVVAVLILGVLMSLSNMNVYSSFNDESENMVSIRYLDTDYKGKITNNNTTREVERYISFMNENNQMAKITIKLISDIDNYEEYRQIVKEIGLSQNQIDNKLLRSRLVNCSKDYHDNLIKRNSKFLTSIPYDSVNVIGFSPFVVYRINPSMLDMELVKYILDSGVVDHVILSQESVIVDNSTFNEVLSGIEVDSIVNNSMYTGDGVCIGIYETHNCDLSNSNLINKDITLHYPSFSVDQHCTKVVSVASLIAPDSEFYVDIVFSDIDLSWLILNFCEVINISFGVYDSIHSRGEYEEILDYQAAVHFLSVVVATGNNNSTSGYYVCHPCYGYNVIPVGGVTFGDNNTIVYDGMSCFVAPDYNGRPLIGAFTSFTLGNGDICSGSSFAAPQIVGLIALMIENDYNYSFSPTRVRASLLATANHTSVTSLYADFDYHTGAGVVSFDNFLNISYSYNSLNSNKYEDTTIYTTNIYLNAGDVIRIGLSWFASANQYDESVLLTEYSLFISNGIYGENYYIPGTTNNYIDYTAEASGLYTIMIYQETSQSYLHYGDYYGLSYYLMR